MIQAMVIKRLQCYYKNYILPKHNSKCIRINHIITYVNKYDFYNISCYKRNKQFCYHQYLI